MNIGENTSITLSASDLAAIIADAVSRGIEIGMRISANERRSSNARTRLYPPNSKWQVLRDQVFSRDQHRCTYCGSDGGGLSLHCDHVIPVSRGGSHDLSNLTTACQSCNTSKRDLSIDQWKGGRA